MIHTCSRFAVIFAMVCGSVHTSAWASESIALSGILGNKALLFINGQPPKLLSVGAKAAGVTLLALDVEKKEALVQGVNGQQLLRMGDAPSSIGAGAGHSANGTRISIPVGHGGHFYTSGTINGRTVKFLVDTGATTIAIGKSEAQRLGIDYRKTGQAVRMNTANGVALGWTITLQSVRIDDVEIFNIPAVVGPDMPIVLLGNSFLSRFSMQRNSDTMTLERRY